MIKTDGVIYRIKTLREYNWLMEKLEKAGCVWTTGRKPTEVAAFSGYMSDTYIFMEDKELSYGTHEDYRLFHSGQERIEVSDLMKKEEETDEQKKLEAIYKQVSDQIADLRKQGKEPKAIVYTIKVCFE